MSRNAYRQFFALIPSRPLQVATVESVSGEVCMVQTPGGGRFPARGTAAGVGAQVFVRDGVIEGAAPSLPLATIEI